MFHSSCPACGASVKLQSSASAFAVCSYCGSGLSRDGDALKAIGRMSEVLEDYSPLQLGTSGRCNRGSFALVGRVQMTYPGGLWNEWHVLFADGSRGWLSDASGQYALMREVPIAGDLPSFEALRPGKTLRIGSHSMTVSDVRNAQCTGAQGELPFAVGKSWTARVVDLRRDNQLATLDYSGAAPVLYQGDFVKLEELSLQMTRSAEEITESAGRIKGGIQSLSCPSCGAAVAAVAGVTHVASCGTCGSTLDVQSKTATLIEEGSRATARTVGTTLRAGDKGTLQGIEWFVLGVVARKCEEDGQTYRWIEYLLFSPTKGLRWLSESLKGEWLLAEVVDHWPTMKSSRTVEYQGASFLHKEAYDSVCEKVYGSFNWQLRAGDSAQCVEYLIGHQLTELPAGALLVQETTEHEQTWTLCRPVAADTVAAAFGKAVAAKRSRTPLQEPTAPEPSNAYPILVGTGIGLHAMFFVARPTGMGFSIGLLTALGLWLVGVFFEDE